MSSSTLTSYLVRPKACASLRFFNPHNSLLTKCQRPFYRTENQGREKSGDLLRVTVTDEASVKSGSSNSKPQLLFTVSPVCTSAPLALQGLSSPGNSADAHGEDEPARPGLPSFLLLHAQLADGGVTCPCCLHSPGLIRKTSQKSGNDRLGIIRRGKNLYPQ